MSKTDCFCGRKAVQHPKYPRGGIHQITPQGQLICAIKGCLNNGMDYLNYVKEAQ